MFGVNIRPKKPQFKPRPVPKRVGTDVPGVYANASGHIAREPNTQYNLQLFFFLQKQVEVDKKKAEDLKLQMQDEKITAKYIKHHEMKRFKRQLKDKVDAKMIEYDSRIEERRKKLTDMLFLEEREFTRLVIEHTQEDYKTRIEEQEKKLKEMQERKEIERQKIVEEKRMQQYLARCVEFRPLLAIQRCKDAAEGQKIQRMENETKKMKEQELEHFWHMMKMKYCAEIDEREEQDRLYHLKYENECKVMNEILLKEKMGERQQRQKEREQEKQELDQLIKDIENEEREFAERAQRTKKHMFEIRTNQIKEQEEKRRRDAEDQRKIQDAYDLLIAEEIRKYDEKAAAAGSQAAKDKADMSQKYRTYMNDMKREQEELERSIDAVIKADMEEIQRKEDAKRCAEIRAKEALQQSVIQTRQQQIEDKRKHDEEMRKKYEMEVDLRRKSDKFYAEMENEYNRVKMQSQKKYQNDLKEQMAYSKVLADREEHNNKLLLESAKVEENLYTSVITKALNGDAKISETHPFRSHYENQKCHCPKPNY